MAILAGTAGLTNVAAFGFRLGANGFAIRNLRLALVGLHAEFAIKAIHDDLEMKLAHSTDDGLATFLIGHHAERRIFLSEALQTLTELFLIGFAFRLDGDLNNRLGKLNAFERDRIVLRTHGVAGVHIAETNRADDIAGVRNVKIGTRIGVHLEDAANAL